MARVNTDILEISELKWMRMANLFQMTIISTAVGKNLLEKKWSIPHNQQKKSKIQYLHAISKKKE